MTENIDIEWIFFYSCSSVYRVHVLLAQPVLKVFKLEPFHFTGYLFIYETTDESGVKYP